MQAEWHCVRYSHKYAVLVVTNCVYPLFCFSQGNGNAFPTDKTKGQDFQYQPVRGCSCVYNLCILLFL